MYSLVFHEPPHPPAAMPNYMIASPSQTSPSQSPPARANGHGGCVPLGPPSVPYPIAPQLSNSSAQSSGLFGGRTKAQIDGGHFINLEHGTQVNVYNINNSNSSVPCVCTSRSEGPRNAQRRAPNTIPVVAGSSRLPGRIAPNLAGEFDAQELYPGQDEPSPLSSTSNRHSSTHWTDHSPIPSDSSHQSSSAGRREYICNSPQTASPDFFHHSQRPRLQVSLLNSSLLPTRPLGPISAPDKLTSRKNHLSPPHQDTTISGPSDHKSDPISKVVDPPDPICYQNEAGVVWRANLQGLLSHLITDSRPLEDAFCDIVLLVCAELTTSDNLFDILEKRFRDAQGGPSRHPQERIKLQSNILMVMICWLTDRRSTIQTQLLTQVRRFCKSIRPPEASEATMGKITELIRLIENTNILPHHGGKVFTSSEMTPRDVAIALTLLEGDKYRALTPADYILHLGRHGGEYAPHLQGSPSADRMEVVDITRSAIAQWVKDYILHPDTAEGRAGLLTFFINAAEECRKLRNFSSFAAIVSALHSNPIARLKLTKAALVVPMQERLESLQDVIDSSSNYRRYRKLLKQVPTGNAGERDRCIPWLAAHLEDLRQPLGKNPTVNTGGGKWLIDVDRYFKFMDRVQEVVRYRPPDLESYREQGQLAYLKRQLRRMEALALSDDDFMKRADVLEPDSANYRTRVRVAGLKRTPLSQLSTGRAV